MSYKKIIVSVAALALSAVIAAPALAQVYSPAPTSSPETATSTSRGKRVEIKTQAEAVQLARIKEKAVREIDRRIEGLNKLSARVQEMGKVSAGEKSAIAAAVQSEIAKLTALKAKINADTDLAALRTDVKSITEAYRIYALIIPMGNIAAAADRLVTLANEMSAIGVKLQTRIAEAQTAGKSVTEWQTALADLNAKVAHAILQAGTATTSIASLLPDLGDQAKFQANKSALQKARADIKIGSKDLKDARDDAKIITKGLKKMDVGTSTATPTATATPAATSTPSAQ